MAAFASLAATLNRARSRAGEFEPTAPESWLAFSFGTFYVGRDVLGLSPAGVKTLVFLMLVLTGQATIYLVREHQHLWSSMPSRWMLAGTTIDSAVVTALATTGTLMAPISRADAAGRLATVLAANLALDTGKVWLLTRTRKTSPPEVHRPRP